MKKDKWINNDFKHVFTVGVTCWVSYKRQGQLTLQEYMGLFPVFDEVLLIFLVFYVMLFCVCFVCLCIVYPMLPVSLDCPFWLPLWISLFTKHYTKCWETRTPLKKNGDNLRCSRSASSSCSISGTCRVTLPEHLVFVGVRVVKALFYIFISNIIIFLLLT